MAKFKKGQKCKVIHNLLAPHCIGDVVTIIDVMAEKDGHVMYRINEGGMEGFASESCLKEIRNMEKATLMVTMKV